MWLYRSCRAPFSQQDISSSEHRINPKAGPIFATMLPQFILPGDSRFRLLLMLCAYEAILFTWLHLYGYLLSRSGRVALADAFRYGCKASQAGYCSRWEQSWPIAAEGVTPTFYASPFIPALERCAQASGREFCGWFCARMRQNQASSRPFWRTAGCVRAQR